MNKLPTFGWSKFRIGALFFSQNGNVDIQKVHINGKGNWVVSSGLANAGIIGRSDIPAKVFTPETITIDMFGNVFYRSYSYKMVTHARVFSLSVRDESITLNKGSGLFLSASLAFLNKMFSFSNMCTYDKIVDIDFWLPIQTDSEGKPLIDLERKYHAEGYIPDWNYMQERIAELEQERIAELEQYLVAAGLNDYELTEQEMLILNASCQYEEFSIPQIFTIRNSRNILKSEVVMGSGSFPYVTAAEGNNSIMGYVDYDRKMLEEGNCIFIGGKTTVFSYQATPFFSNDSHNLLLYCKDQKGRNETNSLYMITQLKKTLCNYQWSNSISHRKIQKEHILLPIQTNEEGHPILDPERKYHAEGYIPDWDYMTSYIRAMKKVVIADVVKYKDEVIAKTRALVSTK